MIVKRRTYVIDHANGDKLHKTVLETEPCEQYTDKSKYIQKWLFHNLYVDTDLTHCGEFEFENLSIKHDGERWVITCTAIERNKETV